MRAVFQNEKLELELCELGYVKVPLFDETALTSMIREFRADLDPTTVHKGFYATMMDTDTSRKRRVSERIGSILSERLKNVFEGYRFLFGNYLVKFPGDDHQVGIHQDWTYVDEEKYRSVNVWCPLVKTTALNGALQVVSGSHHFNNQYRSTPFDASIYNENREIIEKKAKRIDCQPGEAIIYDSRLIHFSEPNLSDEPRYACAAIFTPHESESVHYFEKKEELLVYKADHDFFSTLIPDLQPEGEVIKTLHVWQKANSSDLANFMLELRG